jgi:predicted nucleotidyltransferase
MKIIGIICEYNPFHFGHAGHIIKTRKIVGENECAVVCVMSGNFVQRGDLAVFDKHARAEAAVRCGADLVIELPTPYALLSAEGFAKAGVYILENMGVCGYISFGSETGLLKPLMQVAHAMDSDEANIRTKKWLEKGLTYALARQKAINEMPRLDSAVLSTPNNLLGIEYLRALSAISSSMKPITVNRTGGEHEGDSPYAASACRNKLLAGTEPWEFIPSEAASIFANELEKGLGPVSIKRCESAILSRLRIYKNYGKLAGATEGLENRLMRHARKEPTVEEILEKVKTKRYVMSRLRRMLLCASLDITAEYTKNPPPYIRVLAMNEIGMGILKDMRKKSKLPIITKPASVLKLDSFAIKMFHKETEATDLYSLAYKNENERTGGKEWLQSPIVVSE